MCLKESERLIEKIRYAVNARDNFLMKSDISLRENSPKIGFSSKTFIGIGAGVVDHDYDGNIGVVIFNHSDKPFLIRKCDRIAQLIVESVVETDL